MIQCFYGGCTFHVPLFVYLYVHIEKRREEIWVRRRRNASDERGGTKNQKDQYIQSHCTSFFYQVSIYIKRTKHCPH